MRLGFVVKPLARPELRSHDSRRWQNNPHLSVSLAYLRDVFTYLDAAKITMYRISSELAPYATHPDMPQFHRQVEQCTAELAQVGAIARAADLRLSFHPAQHVVLNSPGPDLVARSAADLVVQTTMLDAMGLGPEAVVVMHLGGIYGDRVGSARALRCATTRRCRARPGGGWRWRTTTSASAWPTPCGFTSAPASVWSSTFYITG